MTTTPKPALPEAEPVRNHHPHYTADQMHAYADQCTAAAQARIAELEAEATKLRTVMAAAAKEIHEHWAAHCDAEGYGPQNLMRRLEAAPEPTTIDGIVEKAWARLCLENCRLFAARHRKEEWAQTILRFCKEAGVTGSPLRTEPAAPEPPAAEMKTLSDEEILACVRSVLLPRPMGLTRDVGPYDVTEPSYYLTQLVRAIERALAEKNGGKA